MSTLQIVLSVLCALTALWLVVEIIRDRQPGNVSFAGLVAVEVGLLVQLVWGVARLFGEQDVEIVTYVGYLVGALLLIPVGFVWSASEKSRSGTSVLLVCVLVIPFLLLRLHDIWVGNV